MFSFNLLICFFKSRQICLITSNHLNFSNLQPRKRFFWCNLFKKKKSKKKQRGPSTEMSDVEIAQDLKIDLF